MFDALTLTAAGPNFMTKGGHRYGTVKVPDDRLAALRRAAVAAASARLADEARALGWERVAVAGSPRPAALAATAARLLATKV